MVDNHTVRSLIPIAVAASLAFGLAGGCAPAGSTDIHARLQDENPRVRSAAAIEAARSGDQSAVPLLIDRLSDSDEDVRFYSILALEQLVGTRMGYAYYGSDARRREAITRWRKWLDAGRPLPVPKEPPTQPTTVPKERAQRPSALPDRTPCRGVA